MTYTRSPRFVHSRCTACNIYFNPL